MPWCVLEWQMWADAFVLLNENFAELDDRLNRRRSPDIVVVDSFQYAHISLGQYEDFANATITN